MKNKSESAFSLFGTKNIGIFIPPFAPDSEGAHNRREKAVASRPCKGAYKKRRWRKIYQNSAPQIHGGERPSRAYNSANRRFRRVCAELDRFLPFVDNWSTCDLISPTAFKPLPKGLCEKAEEWMNSSHTYTCRFGIEMYMKYFLDEGFDLQIPEKNLQGQHRGILHNDDVGLVFRHRPGKTVGRDYSLYRAKRLTSAPTTRPFKRPWKLPHNPAAKEYLRTLRIK